MFIGAGISVPAAIWLSGCAGGGEEAEAPRATTGETGTPAPEPDGEPSNWEEVRALFELDPGVRHLSAYILAPHSRPVRLAIEAHRRGLDADPREYFLATGEAAEQGVANAAATHLGTTGDLVALTDSTSMGLGLVLGGARLKPGDEILTTAHDHYVAHESLRYAAERAGAKVTRAELYPPKAPEKATVKGIVSALEAGMGRATRLVVVTWVHSSSGIKLPLREISEAVARANGGRRDEDRALLVVDAAHGLGTGPSPVEELGCDVFIAGCHKWLLGPRGTGIVWGRKEAWARFAPIIPSFDDRLYDPWTNFEVGKAPPGPTFTPGGFHSFEHRWALGEAFKLQRRIGSAKIEARIAELSGRLREGLLGTRDVRLHVPAEKRLHSGLVCFSHKDIDADGVVERMQEKHSVSASVTPYNVSFARLGTCWVNTEEEVDAAIRAVRDLR